MSCDQYGDFPYRSLEPQPRPEQFRVDVTNPNDRWLIVSNAPETVKAWGEDSPRQLYRVEHKYTQEPIVLQTSETKFRVFLWHVNDTGSEKQFWIVLRLLGGTQSGRLKNHFVTKDVRRLGDVYSTGLCNAKAQLFGSIDEPGYHQSSTLGVGQDVGLGRHVVPYASVNPWHIGAVHEFTVESQVGQQLDVRTVVTEADELGTPQTAVLTPTHGNVVAHNRGSWPYCNVRLASANPVLHTWPTPSRADLGLCETNGLEQKRFEPRGDDDVYAIGNKPLLGVDAEYLVYVQNTHFSGMYVAVAFRARNNGGAYFGAAENVPDDGGNGRRGIPRLRYAPINPNELTASLLTHVSNLPIGGQSTQSYLVRIANAGGAMLPVNLVLMGSPVAAPIGGDPEV